MLKRNNEQGFTLLEIAMVLIVASLIVLATIKAQGIWNEAKYFRLERQVQETQVAVALFERKMGFLPGADSRCFWVRGKGCLAGFYLL